ncbi:MAG: cysteine desulfurase NifS [Dehalococcoidales bacterium]|nr:cysteine desulfurase NifS [Dehalococcoidales bacterium]
MGRIYLDYAATTPTHPDVLKAMLPYFNEDFGNPSTICSYGQEAKGEIGNARTQIANLIGSRDEEIIFTSGGTEADNFAIKGIAFANESKGNHIITSSIEHPAVLETCRFLQKNGFNISFIPVDKQGLVDPDGVRKAITKNTILISIMHANNEIGTIEPIAEISKVAKKAGVYFHTDAIQTAGHIPIDVNELGVDLLSISAHKLYGPKGIGALYIKKGTSLATFMHGGEQEQGRRAGTENVPGIVGFGKAAELIQQEIDDESKRLIYLRDLLLTGILERINHSRLNGHPTMRLPNNANISIDFAEGESMILNLDLEGICAATGSACSSRNLEPSHVLLATGLSQEQAHGSLRFSLGKWTTEDEIKRVLDVLPRIVARLRAMSPLLKNQSKI